MREYWTALDKPMNRKIEEGVSTWSDSTFEGGPEAYLDDDLFGYMNPKKETIKRRGVFEIARAISTRPWAGDVMFGVSSPGANPSISDNNPHPFSVEVHETRYQYLFAMTPARLNPKTRLFDALDAVRDLRGVAGNHSRYLYDFSPDAIVLRLTHDFAPRMMYCFEEDEFGALPAPNLIQRCASGDIDASELYCGGPALEGVAGALTELGASVFPGVKQAFAALEHRANAELGVERTR